jgi:diguanylate cyclase (GGDEF)-like protein/PAS domain S-box-containing protein
LSLIKGRELSTIFTNSTYLLCGVSTYAFLTHLQVGLRKPGDAKHLLFALICLCISLGAPFNALTISAGSVDEYVFATKFGYTFILLFIMLLTWFIPFCTGRRPVYYLAASNVFFALMLILNIVRPYGFQFDAISHLKLVQLPWNESYVLAIGKVSLIYKIAVLMFLALMSYLIYTLYLVIRNNPTKNNIAMLLATFLLVASYLEAILVRTGMINFLPLGTFGGLGLIIVMSIILNKEHADERNLAAFTIAKEHKKLETILKTANDGIYVLDKNGVLVQANDAFFNMLKLDNSAIGHLKLSDWNATLENANLKQQVQSVLKSNQKVVAETQHRRSDGVILEVEVSINAVDIDEDRFLFCASRDITERKILQKELERQAHLDALTSLNNRGYFMLLSEQELARAMRYGRELSLLMLDIDNFKRINDTYGHKCGDIVLQKLAEIFQNSLREVDIIGRLGGEEFAILLPETGKNHAIEIAERLRANIANTAIEILDNQTIKFTVSIGIALLDSTIHKLDDLLIVADKALYDAKNSGRNQVLIADNVKVTDIT